MIPVAFIALGLALTALVPLPAAAQTFAECQAWLCLPGGFPPSECTPAEHAVRARLDRGLPALPSWSSCALRWGWDAANLSHTEPRTESCPSGGTLSGGQCRDTDPQGCTYSGTPQETVTVTVAVDGSTSFSPNHRYHHITRPAGALILDPGQDPLLCGGTGCPPNCPPPPVIITTGVCCPPEAVNYYWTGVATEASKNLVCTHTFPYPPPQYPSPLNAPPPQRSGEPYNPPNCCPPWALHHQWAFDRNSLVCVLGGILPN